MAATKAGKILITEAKRGLGLEMIKQLSENSCPNQHIFAACRDPDVPNSESKSNTNSEKGRYCNVPHIIMHLIF